MPKTLLLADDSVTIQKVVGISFASEDIQLVTVDNGTAAVAKAREVRPDIVLADVVMPGLNGYEVCRQIKSDPSLKHVPVLLLTGTFEAFDEARAREAGSDGHITKPFEAQALVDLVNARLAAAAPPTPPAAASAPERSAPAPLFGDEEEPFDFMADEVTEPSGTRGAPALARDALAFGAPDELEVGAGEELDAGPLEVEALTQVALADADSGIAPFDEVDDENAETLPPVAEAALEGEAPFDDAPAATRVMFNEREPNADEGDAATRVLFSEPQQELAPAAPPERDPFADLIGGSGSSRPEVTATDLGDPFADEAALELAPSPRIAVGLPAAQDEVEAFAEAEAEADASVDSPRDAAALLPNRDELRNALEKMAWEALGDVTDRIVRETVAKVEQIAWEVIPKMAETLIREEIRRLKESDEQ